MAVPASHSLGYRIENRVGRLIEARVFSLRTPDDADAYSSALAAQVARMVGNARPVLCADHRPVHIYFQPVASRLGELFEQMNARLERVAILVAQSNATLLLQLDRLAREAKYTRRKVFHTPDRALEHLGDGLDANESARARAFLAEHGG